MRYRTAILSMLVCTATYAAAQVGIYIREPNVRIAIDLPVYPEFVRVPGYPVYYAPRVSSNVFFYDGLYWVYEDDAWYASSWYNGPWALVEPEGVPLYLLRVPVRYYRHRPAYFHAWSLDAPPRWGERWGATWEQRHIGWDRWDRRSAPAAAPLPLYQRQYSGSRYPSLDQQRALQVQQYRYQPRDTYVRQYYRQLAAPTSTQSANAYAPGQLKRQQNAQSAREFAPGQVKKREGAQSARDYAPGHVRKQQAQVATAPEPEIRDEGEGRSHGQGRGHGQGQGQGQGQAGKARVTTRTDGAA